MSGDGWRINRKVGESKSSPIACLVEFAIYPSLPPLHRHWPEKEWRRKVRYPPQCRPIWAYANMGLCVGRKRTIYRNSVSKNGRKSVLQNPCQFWIPVYTNWFLPISIKFDDVWLLFAGERARRRVNVGSWGGRGVRELLMFQSDYMPIHTRHLHFGITHLTSYSLLTRHFVLSIRD